jgi:hypothetical protein
MNEGARGAGNRSLYGIVSRGPVVDPRHWIPAGAGLAGIVPAPFHLRRWFPLARE